MPPKTTDTIPGFLQRSSNGMYSLPPKLREVCTDARVEPDVLTGAARKRRYEIVSNPCQECGGAVEEYVPSGNPYTADSPLPRTYGKCVDCEHTFDPQSGMTINTSKPWKVEEVLPIIKPSAD